jgi:hypothetical protein
LRRREREGGGSWRHQHYGIDFYGIYKGEILVIVDLFTRETILTFLRNRTQENVARALLTNIIFPKRRSDVAAYR